MDLKQHLVLVSYKNRLDVQLKNVMCAIGLYSRPPAVVHMNKLHFNIVRVF